MSEKNPRSGKPAERVPGIKPETLLCEQWEALLVDALDGTLGANDLAAFHAHRDTCLACAQLLEESKRGSEWLHFLETEPEVPGDLIGKILAQTSGVEDGLPAMVPAGLPVAMPAAVGWGGGWLPMMEKHAAQSRWMMTAATAFFSLAFMLNQTGVKLTGFRLTDLKPTTLASGLTKQYYVANKSVMRYYDNLRFVYELESRVREMRRDVTETPVPKSSQPPVDKSEPKPAAKHTGGSAQVPAPEPQAEPVRRPEPVMARFERERYSSSRAHSAQEWMVYGRVQLKAASLVLESMHQNDSDANDGRTNESGTSSGGTNGGRKNVNDKRSEGSLA